MTANGGFPYVLMYHSIAPYVEDPNLVTIRPERFDRQLAWLSRHGYRGVSMRELLDLDGTGGRGRRSERLVGLTFDDGYADFREQVLPALLRHGFTATAFVLADRIGGHNGWDSDPPRTAPRKALMTVDDIRAVADAGMEIGSHGWRHVSLPGREETRLQDEIFRSRSRLAEISGRKITGFCYPYGHLDARTVAAVQHAGYDYGCAIGQSALTGRYAIPRTYLGERDTAARLLAKRLRHQVRQRWGFPSRTESPIREG